MKLEATPSVGRDQAAGAAAPRQSWVCYKQRFILALAVLLVILTGLGHGLAQRDYANLNYEIFRTKVLHAARADNGRRVLIGGGSNAIWGFRSQFLEQTLGIPTTNLSIEREGGDPAANRELLLEVAHPGDIVVYSSVEFWNMGLYDEIAARDTIKAAGLDIEHQSDWLERIKAIGARYWGWTPRDNPMILTLPTLYRRYILKEPSAWAAKYDEYGDIKTCDKADIQPHDLTSPSNRQSFVAAMVAMRDRLKQRGAELVVDIPWIYVKPTEAKQWYASYQPVLSDLKAQLPVTTTDLRPFIFSDRALFCDSADHLIKPMAKERTKQLASFLQDRGKRF